MIIIYVFINWNIIRSVLLYFHYLYFNLYPTRHLLLHFSSVTIDFYENSIVLHQIVLLLRIFIKVIVQKWNCDSICNNLLLIVTSEWNASFEIFILQVIFYQLMKKFPKLYEIYCVSVLRQRRPMIIINQTTKIGTIETRV